jgi:hypothetical protein
MAVTLYPYTRAALKASVNARIHGKLGLLTNVNQMLDDVVNDATSYLRSAKRRIPLAPNLFNDIYQYAAPTDIDGSSLIDIQPQSGNRSKLNVWEMTTEAEFDTRKQTDSNLVAFANHAFVRTLLISERSAALSELTIAAIQAPTGDSPSGAPWTAYDQATNLQTDNYNFIKGSGALEFDILSGGGTAGIQLANLATFDLTYYASAASVFTWAYLNSASAITNVTLRLGLNASNYYQAVATTPNDGTTFVNGWNLVRFDLNGKTTVGTPTVASNVYAALFLTLAGTGADTGYRFNWLDVKQGTISNLIYYSENPWEDAVTGAYLNNSTADSNYFTCDNDEYPMIVEAATEVLGNAAREYQDAQLAATRYVAMYKEYRRDYPVEKMPTMSTYFNMGKAGTGSPRSYGATGGTGLLRNG